jgi:hypothetical protein
MVEDEGGDKLGCTMKKYCDPNYKAQPIKPFTKKPRRIRLTAPLPDWAGFRVENFRAKVEVGTGDFVTGAYTTTIETENPQPINFGPGTLYVDSFTGPSYSTSYDPDVATTTTYKIPFGLSGGVGVSFKLDISDLSAIEFTVSAFSYSQQSVYLPNGRTAFTTEERSVVYAKSYNTVKHVLFAAAIPIGIAAIQNLPDFGGVWQRQPSQ